MTDLLPPRSPASEVQTQIHYRLVERLSESERRHRALVESLRDPVLQCDAAGRLEYLNHAWSELTGRDRESSLGRSFLDFVEPADLPRVEKALGAAGAAEEGPAVVGEFRLQTEDGASVHVGFTFGKSVAGSIVGSLHDLTSRKEVEESLERARDAAEEASRLKSSFLANMSHEIRTPLSAVLGYSELLAQHDIPASERRDYADRVQRNGEHLLALVSDILDFSRIESGRLDVSAEPMVLCELVDDLEREHGSAAREKGLSFEVAWSGALPPGQLFVTDPTRLRQVLTNLLSNALKFTADGAVALDIDADTSSGTIRFQVVDTGIGIALERVSALFEPFRQADETITRRFGGTGLGLAISARLANLLGGTLRAESEPGKGSRFVLELPLTTAEAPVRRPEPAEARDRSEARSQAGDCRVLVVDDTADLRKLMVRFCEDLGVRTDTAVDGVDAMEHVAEAAGPYKAVLMDMQMPVMDGYTATRRLRAEGYDGLIVAMTAHAMRGDREKCLEAGCDDYLAKPVTRASLTKLFERYCGPA
jgi:PAS domain S-box-containing protein